MDEDFAPPEAYGARTFPEVPYLNRWWHYAAVGVGVYGGLVLLGYAFPVKSRKAPKARKQVTGQPVKHPYAAPASAAKDVPALQSAPAQTPTKQEERQVAEVERAQVAATKAAPAPAPDGLTLSPDEFESALNAARQLMRKGDFEGAEYLFSQCCALLDHHEGEGLHTAYLIVDWAPCLNQLKRFEKSNEICERAMGIVSAPDLQQYDELAQLRIPLLHAFAVACVGLKAFVRGRELLDSALELIKENDPYKAVMLLVKADLLEKEAEAIEKDADSRQEFEARLQEGIECAHGARAVLDQAGAEFQQHPIFYKPDTCIVSIFLTWGRMDEAEDAQEALLAKMAASGNVSQPRLAFQTDEFADICLDSSKFEKAEKLYLDALKIWQGVTGVQGRANEIKAKAELAHKIYFQNPETQDKAQALFQETREFTETHMLSPPKSENMEMRVQKAHFEYVGKHEAGGVEANFVFQIRLKRKIQNKEPRLPSGAIVSFSIVEWDHPENVLVGKVGDLLLSTFSTTLDEECLVSDDRTKRVKDFQITFLRPLKTAYKCLVTVTKDEAVISSFEQHVVSYVDCPTVSGMDEAQEIYAKHMAKCEEILG